ncbi:MAG: flippase-like domain-containing protein [Hyphomicrobiales bacterium]|nr:flippase-like domain-containing protein [Hyphomicrobiales bacterium]MBV9520318.1 flippase-like domain-containing protein [Hyphomicrobiales bacterium]
MKLSVLLGALALAALVAWMLANEGAMWRILELVRQAGWVGLVAVVLFHLTQIAFSAAAWRVLFGSTAPRPSFSFYMIARWIREAVNNLLPVAQIGGEFVGARLLNRRCVELRAAIASAIADLTVELITQIAFTLMGLAVLLLTIGNGPTARLVAGLLVVAAATAGAFIAVQWMGLAHLIEICVMRIGRMVGWEGFDEEPGLHGALIAIYRAPLRLLSAAFNHLISWLLGSIEVWLALHLIGRDVGLETALVIESLGQALKAIGFAVPGALGVQEGGYVIVCGLYGLSPETAIALSLIKRLREVALGLPALAAWQWFEARPARSNASWTSSRGAS